MKQALCVLPEVLFPIALCKYIFVYVRALFCVSAGACVVAVIEMTGCHDDLCIAKAY